MNHLWDELNFYGPPGYPPNAVVPKMSPEGDGSSGICVWAEALGSNEAACRLPLRPYAEAGSVFERMISRGHGANILRSSLTITNTCWYQPPRNWLEASPWEWNACMLCEPLNDELIKQTQPKVILALGGVAFKWLTGMQGVKQGIELCRGFIVPSKRYHLGPDPFDPTQPPIPVIGTHHPAALKHGSKERNKSTEVQGKDVASGGGTKGMSLLGVLIRDILLAKEVAAHGAPKFTYDDYKLGATMDEWREELRWLKSHPEALISYDLETQDSLVRESEEDAEHIRRDVTQAQISHRPGQAIVSSWCQELLPIFKEIIELPNPKADWNGRKFDRPILRDMGIRCDVGEFHDLMDCFHHAQPDIPRGLQYAASFFCPEVGPWKHFSGSDPLVYGTRDVDIPQRIYEGLKATMSTLRSPQSGVSLWGDGKYGGYLGQVVKLAPVLDKMSERGIPVDEDRRSALDEQFSKTLGRAQYAEYRKDHNLPELTLEEFEGINGIADRLQSMISEEVKPSDPAKGYKSLPKELTIECPECLGKKLIVNPAWRPREKKKKFKVKAATSAQNLPKPFDAEAFKGEMQGLAQTRGGRGILTFLPEDIWNNPLPIEIKEVTEDSIVFTDLPEGIESISIGFGAQTAMVEPTESVGKVPKRIPCGRCAGKGRIQLNAENIPPGWTQREFSDEDPCDCTEMARKAIAKAKALAKKSGTEYIPPPPSDLASVIHCEKCQGTGKIAYKATRWTRIGDFNPSSWQQLLKYIKWQIAEEERSLSEKFRSSKIFASLHPSLVESTSSAYVKKHAKWYVPVDYKTGDETTGELELTRLGKATSDLVIPMILEFREISKLRGTYVQGWKPSNVQEFQGEADAQDAITGLSNVVRIGRVHPTFGFRPATGQTSSEAPNAQNTPSHSDLSHAFNKMIRARPGRKMVKIDWSGFHAITGGFEAQDADFVRITRKDIHSFLTLVGVLRLERPEVAFAWKDDELGDRLKWWRKSEKIYSAYARPKHPGGMTFDEIRDEISKRAIYAWEFKQGANSLWRLNPESFVNVAEAKMVQDALKELFGKIVKWQDAVQDEADRNKLLTSRFGFIRRFWDVFKRRPLKPNEPVKTGDYRDTSGLIWRKEPGNDFEACVAFRPANDAFGIKRASLVKFAEQGIDERCCLIDDVHDDVRFECPTDRTDSLIADAKSIMEAKWEYLKDPIIAPDGLWCGVEVKVGDDWDSLKKI